MKPHPWRGIPRRRSSAWIAARVQRPCSFRCIARMAHAMQRLLPTQELNTEEHPEEPVREALGLFLGVVRDSLQWLVAQPQFAHVQLVESSEVGEGKGDWGLRVC